jgi:predicted NBD/HSP70 family sugar kinase
MDADVEGTRPTRAALGARQSSLRSLNLATVLKQLYGAPTPSSRADIAAATGLTRSTVSRLVDELIVHGFARDLDPIFDGQRGRPAVPLAPPIATWAGVGLEVNISHLAARVVDLGGRVVTERIVAGQYAGTLPADTLDALAKLAREALADVPLTTRIAGVQLALPGLVDAARGVLLRAPNLGWHNVTPAPALAEVQGLVGLPLGLGNEADFAALTVARTAPAHPAGYTDFLYLSGEVGIGSSLVSHGAVMTGRHGWAGEIGHVCVDPWGPVCACGARGCLERYAGQHALTAAAGVPDTDALVAALEAGDSQAMDAADQAARALGVALSGALNLLDVSHVILGGHLGVLAPYLRPGILAELDVRVLSAPFEAPTVEAISLDAAPAALGAAYVALEDLLARPADFMTDLA